MFVGGGGARDLRDVFLFVGGRAQKSIYYLDSFHLSVLDAQAAAVRASASDAVLAANSEVAAAQQRLVTEVSHQNQPHPFLSPAREGTLSSCTPGLIQRLAPSHADLRLPPPVRSTRAASWMYSGSTRRGS